MNNTNDRVGLHKGTSTLERARFGPGMLLQHDDLEKLNTYTRDLSRLMFQSFFGCGVVCGLVISAEPDCGKLRIKFTSGLALACSGDPVYVPKDGSFLTDEKLDDEITTLWVVLCGTKKCCAPRVATCSSDDDEATSDCTREKDTYEIRVSRTLPDCVCSCTEQSAQPQEPPANGQQSAVGAVKVNACRCVTPDQPNWACYEKHYNGECGCDCGKCSGCDCQCIVLAVLNKPDKPTDPWKPNHSVRRFIRPVLMLDPQIEKDKQQSEAEESAQEAESDPAARRSSKKKALALNRDRKTAKT